MFFSILKKRKVFKNLIASIAQIVLIVLLLPFAAIIIKIIMPEKIGEFVLGVLGEIPVINMMSDYYMSIAQTESIDSFSLFAYTVDAISSSILSMYIVGTLVYVFKHIGELIGIRGLPVLQTVVGIFASCFCLKLIGDSFEKGLVCLIILFVIGFVLAVLVQKGKVVKFLFDAGLGVGMATITSGAVSAYCAVLVLMLKGWFDSLLSAINVLIWALIPALICLLIDYLLFGRKD